MPKFREKAVEVQAVRLDPCGAHKTTLPEWVIGVPSPRSDNWSCEGCQFRLWSGLSVYRGDWVITRPCGGHTACSDPVFRSRYEPVDEEAAQALKEWRKDDVVG